MISLGLGVLALLVALGVLFFYRRAVAPKVAEASKSASMIPEIPVPLSKGDMVALGVAGLLLGWVAWECWKEYRNGRK